MFTKEALELLNDNSGARELPDINGSWITTPDGKIVFVDQPELKTQKTAGDIDSLIRFSLDNGFKYVAVNRVGVVGNYDNSNNSDHIKHPFVISEEFKLLRSWEKGKEYTQSELLRVLRVDLADRVPTDHITAIRKLRWEQREVDESESQRTKANIGKTLERAVQGIDNLPEILNIPCQYRFDAIGGTQKIRVLIEPNFNNQTFRVQSFKADLDNLEAWEIDQVYARVQSVFDDICKQFEGRYDPSKLEIYLCD